MKMKPKSAGVPFRCTSCNRGWSMLRIADSKLLRCAACGSQDSVDAATEAAKVEAQRVAAVWA